MLQIQLSPFPLIRTERLLMRSLQEADVEQVFYFRSSPHFFPYSLRPPMTSMEEAHAWMKKVHDSFLANEGILWALALPDNPGFMIGNIGIWKIIPENHRGVLGYALDPAFRKQGYMHEAMKEVLHYGFNQIGLNTLMAEASPENAASVSVLEKAGLRREGLLREDTFANGRFYDTVVYGLTKTEFNARKESA